MMSETPDAQRVGTTAMAGVEECASSTTIGSRVAKQNTVPCPYCAETFLSEWKLRKHVARDHKEVWN